MAKAIINTGEGRWIAEKRPPSDPVQHPEHYTKGNIEVIDFIIDQEFDYLDGQVIKYVSRARWKENELEDLKKALFNLERKIEIVEQTRGSRKTT